MFKIFILTLTLSSTLSYNIPSYVHLCKRNDPELAKCFVNTANELRPYLKRGIPEMHLPPMEPYEVGSMKLNFNNTNGNINIQLFNSTMENISTYNATRFAIDFKKGYFDGQAVFKYVKFNSKCRFKGKLMLFDIDSEGDLKLDIEEFILNAEWHAQLYKKGDKEYFKFNYPNMTTQTRGVKVQFENLFKDQVLSDNFNSVINANLDLLLPQFFPIIRQTINSFSTDYFSHLYDTFSLDVLYPND